MPDTQNPLEWAETMLIPFLRGIPEERKAGVMDDLELLDELKWWFIKGSELCGKAWATEWWRRNDRHDATPE